MLLLIILSITPSDLAYAYPMPQLKNVIAEDEFDGRGLLLFNNTPPLHGLGAFMDNNTGEWAYGENKDCQYRVCPRCRPVCADRAFLSLDAVANGEIPPTAAAGFGFEALGGRPVIDKDVIKSINEHRSKVRTCMPSPWQLS